MLKFVSWNVNGLRACLGKGFAELAPEVKNQVSHRGQALKLLNQKLTEAFLC